MGNHNSSSGDDDLSLLSSSSSIQRTDLDFTDMLWAVLHRVESYREDGKKDTQGCQIVFKKIHQ